MMQEVLIIANSMVGETALPDFSLTANDLAEDMRIAAFDELNCVFDGYAGCRSEDQVHVLGHDHERMELEAAFAAVAIQRLQKETDVVLDDEESSSVPGGKGNEIGSRWRDKAARLQEQTSAAEAAIFA